MKKIRSFFVILTALLFFSGCTGRTFTYEKMGISFRLKWRQKITEENDSSLSLVLSDRITGLISVMDASSYVSEDCSDLPTEELDLTGGAFESTLDNLAYVSKLFNYLFDESGHGFTVTSLTRTTFGDRPYQAFYAQINAGHDEMCGYIYMTVEDAKCVIFCFYINDTAGKIFNHAGKIKDFMSTVRLGQVN